jgi:SAM-dependent methyltransferase
MEAAVGLAQVVAQNREGNLTWMTSAEDLASAKRLFGIAAESYSAFRPSYPAVIYEEILSYVPETNRNLAVDFGAGTGINTVALCDWFRQVIAIEPDPKMAARIVSHPNLTVKNASAEICDLPPGRVDLATCATSFHWMDGPRVLDNLRRWLRPGGIFAAYAYPFPKFSGPAGAAILREFHGHWEPLGHPRLADPDYSWRTIRQGPLEILVDRPIPWALLVTSEQAIGFCASTSYANAHMKTLADPAGYLRALRVEVEREARGNLIEMDFGLHLAICRNSSRNPDA